MADENGDVKGVKLADSNMANYGSKAHIDARKAAAATEKEFIGAGVKPGLEVWRVENRRTAADTPDFGVKRWLAPNVPGHFYSGDSYIVLNTFFAIDPETGKKTDKLAWDVHFWLGKDSSQDEIGVAAYKTVELDDLLDDGPVQHREVQYEESQLFQSYFKEIVYMEGGIESGFRKVKPEEYKPRLMHVRRTKKTVKAIEVPCSVKSMNIGDVFVLDAGLKIYVYIGEKSNAFEKMKGGAIQHNIVSSRLGKAKKADIDSEFWTILGGTEKDVGPEVEHDQPSEEIEPEKCKLFRLSDSSGKLTFKHEATGNLKMSMLDQNDVFIVDAVIEVFVWIGSGASKSEKSQSIPNAVQYLAKEGRPSTTPICQIKSGQINFMFASCFVNEKASKVTIPASKTGSAARPAANSTASASTTTSAAPVLKSSGKKLW